MSGENKTKPMEESDIFVRHVENVSTLASDTLAKEHPLQQKPMEERDIFVRQVENASTLASDTLAKEHPLQQGSRATLTQIFFAQVEHESTAKTSHTQSCLRRINSAPAYIHVDRVSDAAGFKNTILTRLSTLVACTLYCFSLTTRNQVQLRHRAFRRHTRL